MTTLLIALAALFLYMCGAFWISLKRKDNGTADIAYGWGFVLVAWVSYVLGAPGVVALTVSLLATVWAARLSIRIYLRGRGKPEDFRYKKWREEWGKNFKLRSFLQVYMLQGLVIFIVASPVLLVNKFGAFGEFTWVAKLGILIWLKGFFFETVGDWQLARFMRNPANKGKILDQGLWKYTRHPNYYGESLMWWGIGLAAASTLADASHVFLALGAFVGPALITFLLLKVSGVPLLEAHFAGNPAWEKYKAKTSVFIPWFPKKK
jgi:steroid 5-alpha reductase family enzyme